MNPASIKRIRALAELNHGQGISLGALKPLVARAQIMIANDTGPRHFAAALGTPVVTLFGPTDPRWAETFFAHERQVSVAVPCGPCQLKQCPIDHRCLTNLTAEMVMEKVAELWPVKAASPAAARQEETFAKSPLQDENRPHH